MTEASTNLFHNTVKENQTPSSKFDIKIYAYFCYVYWVFNKIAWHICLHILTPTKLTTQRIIMRFRLS